MACAIVLGFTNLVVRDQAASSRWRIITLLVGDE
jgi:hypothetical protein